MRTIPFMKMSGTGNDFMLVDNRAALLADGEGPALARAACPRRVSAGADGVILLEPATQPGHDFRMRIYNADGSEAEMCGNGSRCLAVFATQLGAAGQEQKIQTLAGSLSARVANDGLSATVQLSQPSAIQKKTAVEVLGKATDLYWIDTGVPHVVQFVHDVGSVDVRRVGAAIRNHAAFKPRGANANFVEVLGPLAIKLRTYERGVEDETYACGTGAAAAALVSGAVANCRSPLQVRVASGAALTIHFELQGGSALRPFLEGAVDTVYKGEFYWR